MRAPSAKQNSSNLHIVKNVSLSHIPIAKSRSLAKSNPSTFCQRASPIEIRARINQDQRRAQAAVCGGLPFLFRDSDSYRGSFSTNLFRDLVPASSVLTL